MQMTRLYVFAHPATYKSYSKNSSLAITGFYSCLFLSKTVAMFFTIKKVNISDPEVLMKEEKDVVNHFKYLGFLLGPAKVARRLCTDLFDALQPGIVHF